MDGNFGVLDIRGVGRRNSAGVAAEGCHVGADAHCGKKRENCGVSKPSRGCKAHPAFDHDEHGGVEYESDHEKNHYDRERDVPSLRHTHWIYAEREREIEREKGVTVVLDRVRREMGIGATSLSVDLFSPPVLFWTSLSLYFPIQCRQFFVTRGMLMPTTRLRQFRYRYRIPVSER